MSGLVDGYVVSVVIAASVAALALLGGTFNGAIEGWRRFDYRVTFAALAAFLAAPVWPVTLIVLIVFLYRRAFPKPTAEDLEERIRRAEREAGIS